MNATIETIDNTTLAQRLKYLLQANNISPLALAQEAQVGEEYVFEALRGEAQMPYFWTRCFVCLGVTPEQAKSQFGIVWDKHAIPEGGLPLLVKAQPEERVEVNKPRKIQTHHADRAAPLKRLMDSQRIGTTELSKRLGVHYHVVNSARNHGCATPRNWALMLTYLGATKEQAQEWGIPWEDGAPTFPPALPKPTDCRCAIDPPLVPEAIEQLIQANGKDHTPASPALATEDRNKVTQALEHLFDARDLILSTQTENQGQLWRKLIETVEAV